MRFITTRVVDARVIDPEPRTDDRGRFMRAWCAQEFAANGITFAPVQANMGFNLRKGTVRGMHVQLAPAPEAKLVRCTRGSIFDVVVDLRPQSSSYLQWFGVELSAANGRMLYVPEYCGHGYQALEDDTEMHYMTSAFYNAEAAKGARFDDPAFGIEWPLAVTSVSDQDRNWPLQPAMPAARLEESRA